MTAISEDLFRDLIRAFRKRIYVCDVCVRCGATVARTNAKGT